MTMTVVAPASGRLETSSTARSGRPAAQRLYDAEVALHCALQSGVDAWVAAAYDRLHEAIEAYLAEPPVERS